MKHMIYILSILGVMGLAFWAYTENYRTQAALDEVGDLRRDIGQLLETRAVLRAEWAYLNRPDRLQSLADLNFDRLRLMPLHPDQFGDIKQIAYPAPDLPELPDLPEFDALPLVAEALVLDAVEPVKSLRVAEAAQPGAEIRPTSGPASGQ